MRKSFPGAQFLGALALACAAAVSIAEEGAQTAPFITTPDEVVDRMLQLAGTAPGDVVIDLGSGDGRIVIAAAKRFGARGIGIERDPRLVEQSRGNARAAEVADRVSFVEGDVLETDIAQGSVVTVYLLPFLIDKLQPRFLAELKPGSRIVSHAFGMVGWKPDRAEAIRLTLPHPGQGDESMLYLWVVPAEVRGSWQSSDLKLRIYQNYQQLEVEGTLGGRRPLTGAQGVVSGYDVTWEARGVRFRGRLEGARLVGDLLIDGRSESVVLTRAR
jgi:SAM-dependent methyltransferase